MSKQSQELAEELLSLAGITINGDKDFDIQISDDRLYDRVFREGTLGFGESYMDGWWTVKNLDEFFYSIFMSNLDKEIKKNWSVLWLAITSRLFNRQSKKRSLVVGEKHYDTGNDLFTRMLGGTMAYSCGYWEQADNLQDAQKAKFDLICRKLGLKEGMHILDIGCGWGTFLKYASENYGVSGIGVTISKEQAKFAQDICKGLPIEIRLQDYRELDEKFDRIISIGMMEHVGHKNYKTYLNTASNCLKDDGMFLLHTIGSNKSEKATDPWIEKYIFPNSHLPSIKQIAENLEGNFVMEDWHNFGVDYDKTLMTWYENFDKYWPELKGNYDERFYRMWKFYLLSCAGLFRARRIQLWQIVLSKKGVSGGWKSVR